MSECKIRGDGEKEALIFFVHRLCGSVLACRLTLVDGDEKHFIVSRGAKHALALHVLAVEKLVQLKIASIGEFPMIAGTHDASNGALVLPIVFSSV